MTKKQNMIPLKDLNLANRFLFDEVMEDPETHRDVLSITLGKEISILKVNQTEKEGRLSPTIRSIRMDVFSMDEEETIYNTEMQEKRKMQYMKRSQIELLAARSRTVVTGFRASVPAFRNCACSLRLRVMYSSVT